MHIQKLTFFIEPTKLYEFLSKGRRRGKLMLCQDATNVAPSYLAFGERVLRADYNSVSKDILKKSIHELDQLLSKMNADYGAYLTRHAEAESLKQLPFVYGVIGFMAYDTGLHFENIFVDFGPSSVPAYSFMIPDEVVIFDQKTKCMWLVVATEDSAVLGETLEFYESLRTKVFKFDSTIIEEQVMRTSEQQTASEYAQVYEKIREKLLAGETYQVNFSHEHTFESYLPPFDIYKKVTHVNPSSYQFFYENAEFSIISNSPEKLFSVEVMADGSRMIVSSPIKGTKGIKGYESEVELYRMVAELLASDKDKAELEMIVDMVRNDIGRLAKFGSVRVDRHRYVEKFSHVLHTFSDVSGVLLPHIDTYDIFKALFPGASVTGCPKVRTMCIISELEQRYRGVYCGSAGFIDMRGGMQFNIMIRTLSTNSSSAPYTYTLPSGGGIVIDSDPDEEYRETLDKAGAFISVLTL